MKHKIILILFLLILTSCVEENITQQELEELIPTDGERIPIEEIFYNQTKPEQNLTENVSISINITENVSIPVLPTGDNVTLNMNVRLLWVKKNVLNVKEKWDRQDDVYIVKTKNVVQEYKWGFFKMKNFCSVCKLVRVVHKRKKFDNKYMCYTCYKDKNTHWNNTFI